MLPAEFLYWNDGTVAGSGKPLPAMFNFTVSYWSLSWWYRGSKSLILANNVFIVGFRGQVPVAMRSTRYLLTWGTFIRFRGLFALRDALRRIIVTLHMDCMPL